MTFVDPKRVSVVVPSYNHAGFVERCLKSILNQTVKPSELLVIDDGSSDGSVEVIGRILKQCDFPAELIVNQNKGLCATLNESLEKTSGEYFAYLGSDDLWLPEFIEARLRILGSHPNAVLGCGHGYLIDENDKIYDSSAYWGHFEQIQDDARQVLYFGTAPLSSTVFYRRTALAKRGWNENSKLEDYELYLQLAEDGEFAFDHKVLAAWRKHGANTSRDLDFMLNECLEAQKRVSVILGWDKTRLDEVQARTGFFHAIGFEHAGKRLRAFLLYLTNFRGAPSWKILIRSLLRSCIPSFILKIRNKAVRGQNKKNLRSN